MNFAGKLLVAHPLWDARTHEYSQQVLFVYASTAAGIRALVLNRSSELTVAQLMAEQNYQYRGVAQLFEGGDSDTSAVAMLHTSDWHSANTLRVNSLFSVSSDTAMLTRLANADAPRSWRMFSGVVQFSYSEFAQQLAQPRSWQIVEPTEELVFNYAGLTQWKNSIKYTARTWYNKYI
jgi:putative AlgH/UPF0301 family transcriptional regulator